MEVVLQHIGKRFGKEWIVKEINERFSPEEHVAILGPNGSGKSTLLKLIASFMIPTEGTVAYRQQGKEIAVEEVFRYLAYAAPYLELIEKLTLRELIENQLHFKPFLDQLPGRAVLEALQMEKHADKQVGSFSSGMKMRVRLGLAFLSDTPLLLLDEPLSNLDRKGVEWYRQLAEKYLHNRLVIVCSNQQEEEYFFCKRTIVLA